MKTSKVKVIDHVTVSQFYQKNKDSLQLQLVNSPSGLSRKICEPAINRPGLAIAGFFSHFANKRVQVIGSAEVAYLKKLPIGMRKSRIQRMLKSEIPCLVYSHNQDPTEEIIELTNEWNICLFKTSLVTMKFVNAATIILENEFAQSTTAHGCLIDIRGIGILITGKSGVGKSEAALGLIERGASLVADDIVHLRNIGGEIIGSAPEMSRGYLEVRGLGIINVANLFGLKAVRDNKRIDLIVSLRVGAEEDMDRLGLERERVDILDVPLTHVELPVAAGRDSSRLIEVAAIDQHLKSIGYDMAAEFNHRLMKKFTNPTE